MMWACIWFSDHSWYTCYSQVLFFLFLWSYVTQYNKRYLLSTFEKMEAFALSNRGFNKLSNYTKFVKIEVILLKVQALQSVNFLLFSLYFTHCFVHYLRINLANKIRCTFYCTGSHIFYLVCVYAVPDTGIHSAVTAQNIYRNIIGPYK